MQSNLPTAYDIAEKERNKQLENNEKLPFDMASGDIDELYALAMGEGIAKLMPGPEFNRKLYRGQRELYNPCRPSLYRKKISRTESVINEMRFLQFKENIENLPNVQQFSNSKILNYRLFVDYYGLAQHYGLNTSLLDFSSDPFVAAFFATTRLNDGGNKYIPIEDENSKGVFYCFDLTKPGGFGSSQADIIGAQPFQRPLKQSAFSVRIKDGGCLHKNPHVMYQEFRHNKASSYKIYEFFEGGDALVPKSPVEDMVEKVRAQDCFSDDLFMQSLNNLRFEENVEQLRNEVSMEGIRIIKSSTSHSFSEEEIAVIDKAWEEIKYEIDNRLYIRPVLELLK